MDIQVEFLGRTGALDALVTDRVSGVPDRREEISEAPVHSMIAARR
jgi:hypothetical protein